jgi:ubiquinone/menaquinone biosynthesis C-methylase UbiE|tara:strand:- start:2091 stop:2906 length:816 start_codon:yes stop_codon:yes gene_type:complete
MLEVTPLNNNDSYVDKQKELHKKLTKYYDKRYGHEFSILFQKYWNSEILALCHPSNESIVIDFGCGTGILFPDCAKQYNSIVGFDLSYDMITKASRTIPQVKGCVIGDGTYLPFADDSTDLVICRSALHHLPHLDKTLLEIKRVLKTNGVFVFSEPSNDNFLIRLSRFMMYRVSSRFDERDVAFVTIELVQRLEQLGFSVEFVKQFGFLSYLFCGFPDHFPLMVYVPFSDQVARLLILLDKLFVRVPILRNQSFHVIIKVTKNIDIGNSKK